MEQKKFVPNKSLRLRDVPAGTTPEELRNGFAKFFRDKITKINIIKSTYDTCEAFVDFDTQENAKKAFDHHIKKGLMILDCSVTIYDFIFEKIDTLSKKKTQQQPKKHQKQQEQQKQQEKQQEQQQKQQEQHQKQQEQQQKQQEQQQKQQEQQQNIQFEQQKRQFEQQKRQFEQLMCIQQGQIEQLIHIQQTQCSQFTQLQLQQTMMETRLQHLTKQINDLFVEYNNNYRKQQLEIDFLKNQLDEQQSIVISSFSTNDLF